MRVLSSLILLLTLSFSVHAQLTFKIDSKKHKVFSSKKLRSGTLRIGNEEVSSVHKNIFNTWRQYERTYVGYPLFELLDAVYGKEKWRKAKQIVFVANDGYRQVASIEELIDESDDHWGYLAYKEVEKKGFTKVFRKGKWVDPAPYYLVWSGFKPGEQAKHNDIFKWPYQLKTINIMTIKNEK